MALAFTIFDIFDNKNTASLNSESEATQQILKITIAVKYCLSWKPQSYTSSDKITQYPMPAYPNNSYFLTSDQMVAWTLIYGQYSLTTLNSFLSKCMYDKKISLILNTVTTAAQMKNHRMWLTIVTTYVTTFGWTSSFSNDISRIAVDGTPSSSLSNLIFFRATILLVFLCLPL